MPILKDLAKFHGKYICKSSFWEVIERTIFLIKDSKIGVFLRMSQGYRTSENSDSNLLIVKV